VWFNRAIDHDGGGGGKDVPNDSQGCRYYNHHPTSFLRVLGRGQGSLLFFIPYLQESAGSQRQVFNIGRNSTIAGQRVLQILPFFLQTTQLGPRPKVGCCLGTHVVSAELQRLEYVGI